MNWVNLSCFNYVDSLKRIAFIPNLDPIALNTIKGFFMITNLQSCPAISNAQNQLIDAAEQISQSLSWRVLTLTNIIILKKDIESFKELHNLAQLNIEDESLSTEKRNELKNAWKIFAEVLEIKSPTYMPSPNPEKSLSTQVYDYEEDLDLALLMSYNKMKQNPKRIDSTPIETSPVHTVSSAISTQNDFEEDEDLALAISLSLNDTVSPQNDF